MTTSTSCPVCCDSYNRANNIAVTCEYGECSFTACKSCIRKYILTIISEPNCMKCKKTLSEQFLIHNLNRNFVGGEYKTHRTSVLLDKALGQMPDTMCEAMREKELAEIYHEMKQTREAIKKLKQQHDTFQQKVYELTSLYNKDAAIERRKFVMGCPREECRGFLNTSYKCGLCEYYICSACLQVKGPTKEEPHTCNDDHVATATLIKTQTKSCPTCGERISKIDGCDQMWCTNCHNAFSWRTGEVDNGIVHNPHFFQYQRTRQSQGGNENMIIQHGHGQCNTDTLPNYIIVSEVVKRLRRMKITNAVFIGNYVSCIYEFIGHVQYHETPILRDKLRNLENTTPLRISYILGKTEKSQLAETLYTNEQKYRHMLLISNVMNLLYRIGLETIWGIVNMPEEPHEECIKVITNETAKFKELCKYCNIEWLSISMDFRISVPWITFNVHDKIRNIVINKTPIHNDYRKIYKNASEHTREKYSEYVSIQFAHT